MTCHPSHQQRLSGNNFSTLLLMKRTRKRPFLYNFKNKEDMRVAMYTHYDLMKPLVHVLQNRKDQISNQEALEQIVSYLGLNDEQKNVRMENGKNLI